MADSATKTVLVTGASGGIGRALVRALAEREWSVIAAVRDATEAGHVRGAAVTVELDVTDEQSIALAAATAREHAGDRGLDGLVNNAGVIVQGPLELVPIAALRRQFEVNVMGQVAVTQAFLPLLRRARGRIVNIGAISGRVTIPMAGPISASKTALESISDALRMELKHQGVHVSIVEPGAIQTEIFAKAIRDGERDGYAGSAATRRLYEQPIASAQAALTETKPAPVDGVVKAVNSALTARNPRSRYLVGRDARQVALLRKLPEGLRDRALMSAVGLSRDAFAARG